VDELGEVLAQPFLGAGGGVLVGGVVEACGADFAREPVGFAEAEGEGDEVLFYLLLGELGADFVEGVDGLRLVGLVLLGA